MNGIGGMYMAKQLQDSSRQICRCIVVASDIRSDRLAGGLQPFLFNSRQVEALKAGFLRRSSERARRVVSPANVLLCAQEADRGIWQGPFWSTRPQNRFVSDRGAPSSLATVAALLSVASRTPSSLIVVMPSDFWVARESVLTDAIDKAFAALRMMPETVAMLGVVDAHAGTNEDYLIVGPSDPHKGAVIQARVNRPDPRMARRLIGEGAMVASGILLGYAQAFAARIGKYWPHIAHELNTSGMAGDFPHVERRLVPETFRNIPRSVLNSMRLSPPAFPMRAFRLQGSGWCSRQRLHDVQPEASAGRCESTR
jgi:mannose-1-phosphate guanylyltransferase